MLIDFFKLTGFSVIQEACVLFSNWLCQEWGNGMVKEITAFIAYIHVFFVVFLIPYKLGVSKTPFRCGYGIVTGVKTLDLGKKISYAHDSHPDYPAPGSLGPSRMTSIGPTIELGCYGVGFQRPVSKDIIINTSFGVMKDFGTNRNGFNLRPYGYAGHAFSDVNVGGFSSIGVSYHYKCFFVGADFEYDVIKIRHGIDWIDGDEAQVDKIEQRFNWGPKFGYFLLNNLSVEGAVLVGDNPTYNAIIHWWFFNN